MSLKCLVLCAFVLLLSIGASSAERTKTLQPRPVQQVRQSKDIRIENDEPINDLAIDGVDDEQEDAELDELEEQNIAELNKLIDEIEALEKAESRASPRSGQRPSNKRLNRKSSNKRNGNWRKSNNRRTARRGNKRGGNKQGGNKRYRYGRRRRAGAKLVQRPRN